MHLATFRISGSYLYGTVTADSDVAVELWCNDHCDLLHVKGTEAADSLDAVRREVGLQEVLADDEAAVAITADCLRERETGLVEDYVRANDCLLLPPLRYRAGEKVVRVLALDPASLSTCYRDMVADGLSVSVDSKREVESVPGRTPTLAVRDAVPRLTARQRTVLRAAVQAGYYEIPRGATTAELAEEVGLARRTAEEHLRRAERKVVTGMLEYL